MEARADIVKKTPGDLKREEIAQKLKERLLGEWKFYSNYPVRFQGTVKFRSPSVDVSAKEFGRYGEEGGVTAGLELQKKAGKIEDWRGSQSAFQDDGQRFLDSQVRAAYVKVKPQIQVK